MSYNPLSQFFQRWVSRARRIPAAAVREPNRARLRVEGLEDRAVPATLPAPLVSESRHTGDQITDLFDGTNQFQPQAAFDPTNPRNIVLVAATGQGANTPNPGPQPEIIAHFSTDGGATWDRTPFDLLSLQGPLFQPLFVNLRDPSQPNPNVQYSQASSPSVAYARNGDIYISYLVHNEDKSSGAVIVRSLNWNPQTRTLTDNGPAAVVYQWSGQDPALNPVIAVDNNLPSFTDPDTGVTRTDTMVGKGVYIAWNTRADIPANFPANNWNPYAILVAASDTRALSFSPPQIVSDGGYVIPQTGPDSGAVNPRIIFSPVSQGPTNTSQPGVLTFVWERRRNPDLAANINNRAGQLIADRSVQDADPATGRPDLNRPAVVVVQRTGGVNTQIADAFPPPPGGGNATPGVTVTNPINIDFLSNPNFSTLSDLDVTVAITHHDVSELRVELVGPNGITVLLFDNRIDIMGATRAGNPGLPPGPNLGVLDHTDFTTPNFAVVGTVFNDEAPRNIRDGAPNNTPGNNVAPYAAHYRPEADGALRALRGRTAAELSGDWFLRITDFRNDGDNPPLDSAGRPYPRRVDFFTLNFSSRINDPGSPSPGINRFGTDVRIDDTATSPVSLIAGAPTLQPNAALRSADDGVYFDTPAVSPNVGIGPSVSLAYDTSLGIASPYAGRLYQVYTRGVRNNAGDLLDTQIMIRASDNNGQTWFYPHFDPVTGFPLPVNDDAPEDNYTEGNRWQFQPTVTVDPLTGMVVVMWYDARLDASNSRISTYIATSIDGGATFSTQVFLNPTRQARDTITSQVITLEPIPGNLAQAVPASGPIYGFGQRQSVLAYGGQIIPFWTANQNEASNTQSLFNGTRVYTATVQTAAGPRIVEADMGPVTADAYIRNANGVIATILDLSNPANNQLAIYNNTFAPDGTRQIDGFKVVFDRPIDVTSFTAADIEVRYRAPNTPLTVPGTLIPVAWVRPVQVAPNDPLRVANQTVTVATTFFVKFATPQSRVGTYSYTVGPNVRDRVWHGQGVSQVEIPAPFDRPFASTDTGAAGLPIPNAAGPVVSTITVPDLPANVIYDVVVDVNINHPNVGDLRITLIAPDLTEVVLYSPNPLNDGDNFTATRFDDNATRAIAQVLPTDSPFAGAFRPFESLTSALRGHTIGGQWRLRVEDLVGNAFAGRLLNWSVTILPGRQNTPGVPGQPGTGDPGLGNFIDQSANGRSLESPGSFPRASDTVAVPDPVGGVPFRVPYVTDTLPLIVPGPHVTRTFIPGQRASIVDASRTPLTPPPGFPPAAGFPEYPLPNGINVRFDRPVDPYTFEADGRDVLSVLDPNGNPVSGPFTVTPIYPDTIDPLTGAFVRTDPFPGRPTQFFRIGFAAATLPGTYRVTVGTDIQAADEVPRNVAATQMVVEFDRDMRPETFTAADVIQFFGPVGPVQVTSVTPIYPAGTNPPAGTPTRQFLVTFPPQTISGPYSIEFGSDIRSVRADGDPEGDRVDTNRNAGLDVLRGGDPASGQVQTRQYTSGLANSVAIPPAGTVSIPITINDALVIRQTPTQHIQVQLNVQMEGDAVPNLEGTLVSPDGLRIPLFTRVGGINPGTQFPPRDRFLNTIFDDFSAIPIQAAQPPFDSQGGLVTFNPQFPLSQLVGQAAQGTWRLEITNTDDFGQFVGTFINWSIRLPFAETVTGTPVSPRGLTGLGEAVADRFTAGFRVFIQDPTNPVTRQQWTPVGPASINDQANAGRVNAIAVDPSDPSGNTVYAGGATGGVWKTTNFLTTDPKGPSWQPLTDFGPTTSLNIASIALFPRNNDPAQTMVFALTGDPGTVNPLAGGYGVRGVGVLRSLDAGRTWELLDSQTNYQNNQPIPYAQRDHLFAGAVGYKIVADPTLASTGEVVLYMATSAAAQPGQGGIWRSLDSGKSWQLVRAGQATDLWLVQGSIDRATGLRDRLYGAFRGQGIFFTSQATAATSMALLAGGGGSQVRDILTGAPGGSTVGVQNNPNPNVPQNPAATDPTGRYALAGVPATGNPLLDSVYSGWLYVIASTANGTMSGLWMTKDFGTNWTRVQLPLFRLPNTADTFANFGTNDESRADVDPFVPTHSGQGGFTAVRAPQGEENISLAVDPLNPNILYVGGIGGSNGAQRGTLRVDVTKIRDPQNFAFFNNHDPGNVATVQTATEGGAQDRDIPVQPYNNLDDQGFLFQQDGVTPYTNRDGSFEQFLNLSRDPNNPFVSNATLQAGDILQFTNDGADVTWMPFDGALATTQGFVNDIISIVPYVDPTTRRTRLVYASGQGVYTAVDRGDGVITDGIGFAQAVRTTRNGNLQLGQFYQGAVQPSQLAADIAGSLFYAMSRDNGFPVSSADILRSGNTNWRTQIGDGVYIYDPTGTGVATGQTGTGLAYQHRFPNEAGPGILLPTDWFRILFPNTDHAGLGISRTGPQSGPRLPQLGDDPATNAGQWPGFDQGGHFRGYFALNPVDPNGLVISSAAGRVFRSTDGGLTWFVIAEPGQVGGAAAPSRALAFGAPRTTGGAPGARNDFIYVGNLAGDVFVTQTAGAPWTNTGNLGGASVMQIIPNPRVNSTDAFAVTLSGVWYNPDTLGGGTWRNITGNLFSLTVPVFGNAADQFTTLQFLTSLAVDWRYQTPIDPTDPTAGTRPNLYVGGYGGVFKLRTLDPSFTATWSFFPDATNDGAARDGGYLPNVWVTDLDLALGNMDPNSTTGLPNQNGGLNMLVATTFGRGSWAIRLPEEANNVAFQSGPAIVALINPNPTGGPSDRLQVRFSGPVDPASFTPDDIVLVRQADGQRITVSEVRLISTAPPGGANPRDLYEFVFPAQIGPGLYTLSIGPNISDLAGNLMNQNGNQVNGEPTDVFNRSIFLNGTNNSLTVTGLSPVVSAGVPTTFTVTATDSLGDTLTGYTGTVQFTSTDPAATMLLNGTEVPLPATYTFTPQDAGSHTFTITFRTAGPQSVTVTPTVPGSINPATGTTTVVSTTGTRFDVAGSVAAVEAGGTVTYTVTARDQFGNVATGYNGAATITNTDPQATLGAATPLPAGVVITNGVGSFTLTLRTAGSQTVTVIDSVTGASGFTATTVTPGPATGFTIAATTTQVTPGQPLPFTVTAFDRFGNVAVGYTGTVQFTSTDPAAGLPPDATLTNGVGSFTATFQTVGTHTLTATDTADPTLTASLSGIVVNPTVPPPPPPTPTATLPINFAVGSGAGGSPDVQVFTRTGAPGARFTPFPAGFNGQVDPNSPGFTGGIRVAVGDVTGDGVDDYVVGTGPTISTFVKVYDGATGREILAFQPFEDTFLGGVFVSVGDVTGDGVLDIAITPDEGGGPRVIILEGRTFRVVADFFGIDDPAFRGGARSAIGDINGDGFADVAVAAGFLGGPRVAVYDGRALAGGQVTRLFSDFFIFDGPDAITLRNGAFVAIGDVDGDGFGDVIGGGGPGGGPRVLALSGADLLRVPAPRARVLANFFAGDPANRGGVNLATKNLNGDRYSDLLTGPGVGVAAVVTAYNGATLANANPSELFSLDPFPGFTGGVYVG
jgi:subtilisin-like proprotein convertase family protein